MLLEEHLNKQTSMPHLFVVHGATGVAPITVA